MNVRPSRCHWLPYIPEYLSASKNDTEKASVDIDSHSAPWVAESSSSSLRDIPDVEEHVHFGRTFGLQGPLIGDDIHLVYLLVAELFLMLHKHNGDRASDG